MSIISETVGSTVHEPVIGGRPDRLNTPEHEPNKDFLFDQAVSGETLGECTTGHQTEGWMGAKVSLSLFNQDNGTSDSSENTANMTSTGLEAELKETAKMIDETNIEPTCTSTPVSSQTSYSKCGFNVSKDQVRFSESCKDGDDNPDEAVSSQTNAAVSAVNTVLTASNCNDEFVDPKDISVPIRGYEIMEQRARFTVFKIQVYRTSHDSWYVFRRYTDFVQLNDKLVVIFPGFRLALPSKKWFGDNFDPNFLEDRQLGLQAFINNITGHKDICNSKACREFFCFDDPPGPHDSLEESRALCESLEEQLYNTKKILEERDVEIGNLKEERDIFKAQVESLQTSLRIQRTLNKKAGDPLLSPQSIDAYLAECDQPQPTQGNKDRTPITDVPRSGDRSPESGIGEGTVTTPTEDTAA